MAVSTAQHIAGALLPGRWAWGSSLCPPALAQAQPRSALLLPPGPGVPFGPNRRAMGTRLPLGLAQTSYLWLPGKLPLGLLYRHNTLLFRLQDTLQLALCSL